jgi:hypothetical protein
VLVLAGVAAADALRGGSPASSASGASSAPGGEALRGPFVPPPGHLPGSLTVVAADTCRLATLDLATALLQQTDAAGCDVWASPGGELALVSASRRGSRYELWLAELGDSPRLLRPIGPARGEPSWSSNGTRIAWCTPAEHTRVLDLASGDEYSVAGCLPRLAPDGSVLTRGDRFAGPAVLRDGTPVLGELELARGFDAEAGHIDVLGIAQDTDGTLAVAVASLGGGSGSAVVQLWRDGRLVAAHPLPLRIVPGIGAFGELLRFSPTGGELAIGFSRPAFGLMVLDLRSGRVVREMSPTRGFAWSPDGRWLAMATRNEVLIAGAVREEATYVLPLAAGALAWS